MSISPSRQAAEWAATPASDAGSAAEPMDVRGALAGGMRLLEEAGVSAAALSAELLLLHVLGRDRAWLYAHPEHRLKAAEQRSYEGLLGRRASGVPAQYLTGEQEFWGLAFEVAQGVLIPRPETEHLVEVVLAQLGDAAKTLPLRIADVGTGSGCLAVALAFEFPKALVIATDISPEALQIARRNALRHKVAERIEFTLTNLLDSCGRPAQFDVIVSNPPYIASGEAAQLPREVRDHEPHAALFGGASGLELYAPLIEQAQALLRPGGLLAVEVGYTGAESVRRLLTGDDWAEIATQRDLAGIERVVSAKRNPDRATR